MKILLFTVLGTAIVAGLLMAGLAACTRFFARPLPPKPPHDTVIGYSYSPGMTVESLQMEFTMNQLHYQHTGSSETIDVVLPVEAADFRKLYDAVRENHMETLRTAERAVPMQDGPGTQLQVRAPSVNFIHTIATGGWVSLPDSQVDRYASILGAMRGLAQKTIDSLRRPVTVCVDTGTIKDVLAVQVGHLPTTEAPALPACHEGLFLNGARYRIELAYRTETTKGRMDFAYAHFVLEPGVSRVDAMLEDDGQLRIRTSSD